MIRIPEYLERRAGGSGGSDGSPGDSGGSGSADESRGAGDTGGA